MVSVNLFFFSVTHIINIRVTSLELMSLTVETHDTTQTLRGSSLVSEYNIYNITSKCKEKKKNVIRKREISVISESIGKLRKNEIISFQAYCKTSI